MFSNNIFLGIGKFELKEKRKVQLKQERILNQQNQ